MITEPVSSVPLPATQIPSVAGPHLATESNALTDLGGGPLATTQPPGGDVKYPKFITPDILRHLLRPNQLPDWPTLVKLYLDYEVASPSKSVSDLFSLICATSDGSPQAIRLSSKDRPEEVTTWLKKPNDPDVHVSDAAAFGAAWVAWWVACQPLPRLVETGWPLPQVEVLPSEWGKMVLGGRNDIFLFVMAMSWWTNSIDPTQPPADFCHAFADLKWVLEQLSQESMRPPTPAPPPESSLGKRSIRLSEKASDVPERMKRMFSR